MRRNVLHWQIKAAHPTTVAGCYSATESVSIRSQSPDVENVYAGLGTAMAESSSKSTKRRKARKQSLTEPPWMSSSRGAMTKKLQCSICLDVLNDPVSTSCGHNFCKICLNKHWNNSQDCSCPNCKETFKKRPELKINTTLRDLVDEHKMKTAEKQPEVLCDICEEEKLKAVKSCLIELLKTQTDVQQKIQDRIDKIEDIKHSAELRKVKHLKGWRHQQENSPSAFHLVFMWFLVPVGISLLMLFYFSSTDVETLDIKKLSEVVLKRMQQYEVDVTLDPDTANPYLILSDDNKQVKYGDIKLKLPDNPKRFDYCPSVLGKQGFLSGRFYYEVHVKGKTEWTLGVARESVNRKGEITLTPVYGFWTVWLRNENEYKAADSPSVLLSVRVSPQKVGVFVDYEEGLVSFYEVESRSHIYSFTNQSFNEKLYPYFNPCNDEKGKNSAPLIITPIK